MARSEAKTAALLLSFSAVLALLLARALFLQPPRLRGPLADLLLSALYRFDFDGLGLLDLINRRNMVLLCHAILLIILRDAGILSSPARPRCSRAAATSSAVVADGARGARPLPHARTSNVVWRPRNRAAGAAGGTDSAARLIKRQRKGPRRAAPPLTEPSHVVVQPVATEEIVLMGNRRSYLDDGGHHRAAVVELEQAAAVDGSESSPLDFGRRIIVAHDDERNRAGEETAEVELADDRTFEEFIANMRRKMQQERLHPQPVKVSMKNDVW